MNPNIYITTTIPYVNASPHVGHAQEFILTDVIARLYRLNRHRVTLQTGTDENAFKNVVSARASGVDPLAFVTLNAEKFRHLADQLGVSYDEFIRTTDERHARGVQKFWRSIDSKDLEAKTYSGLYCQGCEDFCSEKDLVDGLCPDHKTSPHHIEEENTFFRLSRYQERLEKLIASDDIRIVPQFRKNEVLSFIRQGLKDISITRDAARSAGWGIKVPGKPDQVIYVWIDALVNYLSGQGYGTDEKWREVWNSQTRKIHVIGKNVWKFHAVYWPALLLSAGLPLPNEIIVHGFLTIEGQKISKSLGNAVDPGEIVATTGADSLRHYLVSHLSLYQDADFSQERLRSAYDADFANTLGNLVSRLAALSKRAEFDSSRCIESSVDVEFPAALFDAYDLQALSSRIWGEIGRINAEINQTRPWELLKVGDLQALQSLLREWVGKLHCLAYQLSCFIPESSAQVRDEINRGLSGLEKPLFPRIGLP